MGGSAIIREYRKSRLLQQKSYYEFSFGQIKPIQVKNRYEIIMDINNVITHTYIV